MRRARTYSVSEVAQVLGVGHRSVYQAIRDGRLPAIRVGRKPKLRIPRLAIEQLLEDPTRWQERVRK